MYFTLNVTSETDLHVIRRGIGNSLLLYNVVRVPYGLWYLSEFGVYTTQKKRCHRPSTVYVVPM